VKILLTVASLRPSYGGPAFSVSQLACALAKAGGEVGVWAADGSAVDTPLPLEGVKRLAGPEAQALDALAPDLLHDNGIWLPHNHRLAGLAARRGLPRVVSTRGMLEPWAFRHKGAKKQLAWALYQRRDLKRARFLHATAQAEAQNLQELKLGVPVETIVNGVDLPAERPARAPAAVRTALFLGRIYPVKGLPMLVEAWARVRPAGWVLEIAGPDEAGHRAQVEAAVRAAGLADIVRFSGPLAGEAKQAAFHRADLFVLPSHSESFGMAVGEALAHGLPVLATTAAPWPMLKARGCGWWVAPSVEGLADGLRQATAHDAPTLRAMGAKGRALVAADFSWEHAAGAFTRLYEAALR
jgi:glycosyltransferase involved in cell wall biosynthesis